MTERLRYDLELEVEPLDQVSAIDRSIVGRSIREVIQELIKDHFPTLKVAILAVRTAKKIGGKK